MFVVHGTKKLRDRVPASGADEVEGDEVGVLGRWYATVMLWRPQLALFVHEDTLLPVVMPLAPAATLLDAFPDALAEVLELLGIPEAWASRQLATMGTHRLVPTASRSVVGVMNEFVRFADAYRRDERVDTLLEMSLWISQVPCSPLYKTHISPDRAVIALAAQTACPPPPAG